MLESTYHILKSAQLYLHHTAFKHVDGDLNSLRHKLPDEIKCSNQLCWWKPLLNMLEDPQGGTSLAVQWLRLHAPNAGGTGSIPGRGTKIPHAPQCSQRTKFFLKRRSIFINLCPLCPLHQCNLTLIDPVNIEWIDSRTRAMSSCYRLTALALPYSLVQPWVNSFTLWQLAFSSVIWSQSYKSCLPLGDSQTKCVPCGVRARREWAKVKLPV